MARRRTIFGICCLVALSVWALDAAAARQLQANPVASREYQIKAAFLYNFARFVEWPDGAFDEESSTMLVCVLGTDPFGRALDNMLEGKQVRGRKIQTVRLHALAEGVRCQILFVSASERARAPEIIVSLAGRSILTVGDLEGFAQMGGVINFTIRKNKIRFQINRYAADRAGLVTSSSLLRLAEIVEDRARLESD